MYIFFKTNVNHTQQLTPDGIYHLAFDFEADQIDPNEYQFYSSR